MNSNARLSRDGFRLLGLKSKRSEKIVKRQRSCGELPDTCVAFFIADAAK